MAEKPWAYIAHKNGEWGGVCIADIKPRSLQEFLSEFAADGYTLQPVFSREEYLEVTGRMSAFPSTESREATK